MSNPEPPLIDTQRPSVRQNRRWPYGVAVAAILVAVAILFSVAGRGPQTIEEAADSGDPAAVLQVFHQKWSDGNVDGALAYLHPSLLEESGEALGNLIEYTHAISPGGFSISVTECSEQAPDVWRCRIGVIGDPIVDAMNLSATSEQFRFEDGLMTQFGLSDYRQADLALALVAQAGDPDGYQAACGRPGPGEFADGGVVYNRTCGEFLAPFVDATVAGLAGR